MDERVAFLVAVARVPIIASYSRHPLPEYALQLTGSVQSSRRLIR